VRTYGLDTHWNSKLAGLYHQRVPLRKSPAAGASVKPTLLHSDQIASPASFADSFQARHRASGAYYAAQIRIWFSPVPALPLGNSWESYCQY
jgi:hypothetical protein